MDIFRIHGIIKDYAWGSRDYLPSLLSYQANGKPQAEAWFSTCSNLEDGQELSSLIFSDSEKYLGPKKSFPLLLKVLAIQKPLSLQCHPDKADALEGFDKDEKNRKIKDGVKNYKDNNSKQELFFALTPSTIMCGFRPFEDAKKHLQELIPVAYQKYLSSATSIKTLFYSIFNLKDDEKVLLLREYISALENSDEEFSKGQFLTEKGIALSSFKEYPEDIALLCPYLLNIVHLRIGEALYVKPKTVHSCIYGNGIELSSCSDNVIRAGLTKKNVDIAEFVKIMNSNPGGDEKVELVKDKFGRIVVKTPIPDFDLLSYSSGMYEIREQNSGLVLVTDGIARFSYGGEHIELKKGEAAFIPYCVSEYTLKLRGKMFFARVLE